VTDHDRSETLDLLEKLRAILPGTPDALIAAVVDVVARDLERRGGRPRSSMPRQASLLGSRENLSETCAKPTPKPHSSQLSGSDLRSGSSSGPSQSDLGISKLDGPTGLEFPVVGDPRRRLWPLGKARVAEWAAAFPGVDVMTECRKALAWVNANERNRKTWDGMPKFLFKWMARAQDRGGRSPANLTPAPTPGLCQYHLRASTAGLAAQRHDETCSECRHVRARATPRPPGEPTTVGGSK
jgi:hypothetical protein